jgi:hypothetical protein
MSTEDQNAVIVRLLQELTQAKKELALVREDLRSIAHSWNGLSQVLEKAAKGDPTEARFALNQVLDSSVVDRAKSLLNDMERLPRRIEEIQATLRAAGIEN